MVHLYDHVHHFYACSCNISMFFIIDLLKDDFFWYTTLKICIREISIDFFISM
jgi:hypothetical protein